MYKLQNSLVFSNKNIVPYLVSLYVSYLCSKVLKILHAILQLTVKLHFDIEYKNKLYSKCT